MKKDDNIITTQGTITKICSGSMFKVQLDNGFEILGILSGKMRKFNIRMALGDRVQVEMSAYDLTKGRIVYRLRDAEA